jgi:hypothetical protein
MSKQDFINWPKDKFCATTFSLGPPGSGKTFVLLNSLAVWLDMGVFDEIHLVLPMFKKEMDQQYEGLDKIPNVFVYESYNEKKTKALIQRAEKEADEISKGKKIKRTKIFYGIDDATSQRKATMRNEALTKIATESRHLHIHFWACLHHTAGILEPAVRNQTMFLFLYPGLEIDTLKTVWKFISKFQEFRKFQDFLQFWDEEIDNEEIEHGCFHARLRADKKYSPYVYNWFCEDE